MKKILILLPLALFLLGCSGSSSKNEDKAVDSTAIVMDENQVQEIENSAKKIVESAEELATEVDSVLETL